MVVDLVLCHALYDAAELVLVLQNILGKRVEVLLLYMHHAVLHKLHACHLACVGVDFLFLHLDAVLLHQLVLGKLPAQLLDHLREVAIQILGFHVFVCSSYPAFEESFRKCKLTGFLQNSCLGVESELVLGILCHVALNLCFHASAELLLILRRVSGINLGKQLAVDGGSLVARDGGDSEGEVAVQVLDFVFLQVKQRGYLCLVLESLHRIEGDHVVNLCALEELGLLLVSHVLRVEDSVLLYNTAFLLLGQRAAQNVTVLYLVGIYILTEALGVRVNLVIHHLVVNGDSVCCQFVLAGQFGIELLRYSDVEGEGELGIVVQIHRWRELIVGQRVTEDVELLLLNVLVEFFGNLVVQHVSQDALAVHLFDQSCGHHTFAEARYVSLLTDLTDLLGYCLLVIGGRECQRDYRGEVFEF